MKKRVIALDESRAFAALSGDHNPMHVDPVYARRLLFGKPVIHGVYLVLWGLNEALETRSRLLSLAVAFNAPVLVGSAAELVVEKPAGGSATITVRDSDGNAATTISFAASVGERSMHQIRNRGYARDLGLSRSKKLNWARDKRRNRSALSSRRLSLSPQSRRRYRALSGENSSRFWISTWMPSGSHRKPGIQNYQNLFEGSRLWRRTPSPEQDWVQAPPRESCSEPTERELASGSSEFDLGFEPQQLEKIFPALSEKLPPDQIAALLACTRLVGMKCPGLNSIFKDLKLSFSGNEKNLADSLLHWQVMRYERRFRMMDLQIQAPGMTGTIKAFVRPPPAKQPEFANIKKTVEPGLFADQHALIAGGSRGLGELAAKLLAAGGAQVILTYHRGREDAERVAAEIGANASTAALDINNLNESAIKDYLPNKRCLTHLYYFATPHIKGSAKGRFSKQLFDTNYEYFITGFARLVAALKPFAVESGLRIFYPSSVFVEDVPYNMGEYAAAKAAGEVYCHYMAANDRRLKFHIARLPRMQTDQTASLLPQDYADSLNILLGSLKKLV